MDWWWSFVKHEYNRICRICGEPFTTDCKTRYVCSKQHYRPCPTCGKPLPINRPSDPVKFCSRECSREFTKKKNLEKYGVEHPMQNETVKEHFKQAMLSTYGVDSPLKSEEIKQRAVHTNRTRFGCDWALGSPEIREQIKSTNIRKFGVPFIFQSEELKEKSRKTCMAKYGVPIAIQAESVKAKAKMTCLQRYGTQNPMQSPEIIERNRNALIAKYGSDFHRKFAIKARDTCIHRYGVPNISYLPETIDKITETFMQKYGVKRAVHVPEFAAKIRNTTMQRYGVPYYVLSESYRNNNGTIHVSSVNKKFSDKLDAFGIQHTFEYIIDLKRYDICIPDRKILIELDPTYTHNTIGNHWNANGLDSVYHLDKTRIAEEHGFRCIHIFDWDNQFEIVNLLCHKEKIYARKCELRRIEDTDVIKDFENSYHLQGYCRGQTVCYGLYYENNLIQIMTFGTPRYNKRYQWELLRLCTTTGYYVVGGAERIFAHFIHENNPVSIISYCDKSKFSGDVYSRIGFTHLYDTTPTKVWSRDTQKITNNLLLQRGFDQLFKTNYGKDTSNELLMVQHGWLPVYDCGQGVYSWGKPKSK